MAGHAGFAVVGSIRQGTVNALLRGFFDNVGPFFFPLPQTINVGGNTVAFGGVASIAAPVVELHPNPADAITAHFAFFSSFRAQVNGGPPFQTRVRLDATVTARLVLGPLGGHIVLRLDTPNVTIHPLGVTVLSGSAPPAVVIQALQSQTLAAAATQAVQAIPPVTIRRLVPATLWHTEPATFPDTGFSKFEWFTISVTVSRVELRVFEGAVTMAADFAGITHGDRNGLEDLTRTQRGAVYIQTITPYTNTKSGAFLAGHTHQPGADLAVAVNNAVLSHIVQFQISPQIAGTPVAQQVVLRSIRAGYSFFDKPLRGKEHGLFVSVSAQIAGTFGAAVDVYLQPYLRTWDGPTNFISHDAWFINVARVDVHLPLWVEATMGLAQATFVGTVVLTLLHLIVATPAVDGPLNSLNDVFAKADTGNLANSMKMTVQGEVWDPGLPMARYISVTPESINIGYGTGVEPPFTLPQDLAGGAAITPRTWSANARGPIPLHVALQGSWQRLAHPTLQAVWEVRRADSNVVAVTGSKPYHSAGGNGVYIPHHSKDLYTATAFIVKCTLTTAIGGQVGEIWSGTQTVQIEDHIDRSHSFVEWGPKVVYFKNQGTGNQSWARLSRSRIHRTAVAARCQMLRRGAAVRETAMEALRKGDRYRSRYPQFRYRDTLPFAWEELQLNQKMICEYCFYGGPFKWVPYPREDWFEPNLVYDAEHVHVDTGNIDPIA